MTRRVLFEIDASDVGRLRCDAPRCSFVYREALPWSENLIGHRCPRCGSDMLTRRDYDRIERLHAWLRWANRWFGWLGHVPGTREPTHRMGVRYHGDRTTIEKR